MIEYLKFWIAKELSGLFIVLGVVALVAFVVFVAVMFDAAKTKIQHWRGGSGSE